MKKKPYWKQLATRTDERLQRLDRRELLNAYTAAKHGELTGPLAQFTLTDIVREYARRHWPIPEERQ